MHMHDYARFVAMVESKDGLDNTTYREGYCGGLWQVDDTHQYSKQVKTHMDILNNPYWSFVR